MEQKDYGRVMAKPKILVNDNQVGTIEYEGCNICRKNILNSCKQRNRRDQTNLIQTEIDYAPYDAGITLKITPHISESDLLRLDIDLIRKDFGTITGDKTTGHNRQQC